MNHSLKHFAFSALLAATMAGCAEDNITQQVGPLPDETPMNQVGGQLYSAKTFSHRITLGLYEGDAPTVEKIGYTLTKPAPAAVTVQVILSPELVASYNEDHDAHMAEFPAANVTLQGGGTLTVPAGKESSGTIEMSLSPEGLKPDSLYLLAVTLKELPGGIEAQDGKQIIYYRVGYREKVTTCIPNGRPIPIPPFLPDLISVVYVNTSTYQPLIVNAWGIKKDPYGEEIPYSIGNIANLKKATIGYDAAARRASLDLNNDLAYVLEHRDKYLRPLQENGHKVCLCIENGGKGVGFCNLNDAQTADFVRQVKSVVERYALDGVNLWDDDGGYGKAGMPALNTASYPKLIKALREALPGKLLTLVDKGEATGSFYDATQCGGIEVGKYIDYAWHGYCSTSDSLQIINPNLDGGPQTYSKYTRKSIAGLDVSRYGSIDIPLYPTDSEGNKWSEDANMRIAKWKSSKNKKSRILVYGGDFIGAEYNYMGHYIEYSMGFIIDMIDPFMDDGTGWDFSLNDFDWKGLYEHYILDGIGLGGGVDLNAYRKDW